MAAVLGEKDWVKHEKEETAKDTTEEDDDKSLRSFPSGLTRKVKNLRPGGRK